MLDREQLAQAIYEAEPYCVSGEYVDGFAVSSGGAMSWEQVKAWDAEFAEVGGDHITEFPYRCADLILARQRQALENDLQADMPKVVPTVPAGEPVNVPHDGYVFGVDEYGKQKVFLQLDVTHLTVEAVDAIKAAVAGGTDNGRSDDAEPSEPAGDHAIH